MTLTNEQYDALLEKYNSYVEHGNQICVNKKDYLQAVISFSKAIAIGELMDDSKLALRAKMKVAQVYYKNRKPKEAYKLYCELSEYDDIFSEEEYLRIQNNKGITLFRMGRFQEATDYFEIIVAKDNPTAKRKAFNNMGVMFYCLHTFFEQDCLDRAIQCFEKAYSLSSDDQLMRHRILRNTGMAFYEKKDYSTSLRKLKESLLLTENKIELASTLNELAKVYIGLHDYDQALQNLREAEKILLQKDYRDLEELSRNIFIHGLLAQKQNRIESAFSHFRTALQGFVEMEIYSEAALVCRELYQMFKESKPERASFFLDQYQFYLNYLDPMES